ncbi:MAG: porin [Chlorobaculum sp.]|nr:porin [Chlorobaculum sp.]
MKKMLSLAAMFAVLAYASPASAELKLSGDASMRLRGQFEDTEVNGYETTNTDDLNFAYRLRLKAAADLGNGYFVKALLTTDTQNKDGFSAGGWNTVTGGEDAELDISQLYFGRMQENCHWMVGRLPLNSVNNPIFDLTLYPIPFQGASGAIYSLADTAVATYNMDRVYGLNYGGKLGSGEANATLVVFDNNSKGDQAGEGNGIFNDGYALHLSYKDKLGDVTVEPQAIISLTNLDGAVYQGVTPNTFGANLSIPAGDAKIGISAFYTACDDTSDLGEEVDYSGYLLRLKGEVGNFLAWIDYNQTNDKTDAKDNDYDNLFVWAQYKFNVYESAAGSFSLIPTVRYWALGGESNVTGADMDYSRLRTELVATVTF